MRTCNECEEMIFSENSKDLHFHKGMARAVLSKFSRNHRTTVHHLCTTFYDV